MKITQIISHLGWIFAIDDKGQLLRIDDPEIPTDRVTVVVIPLVYGDEGP